MHDHDHDHNEKHEHCVYCCKRYQDQGPLKWWHIVLALLIILYIVLQLRS